MIIVGDPRTFRSCSEVVVDKFAPSFPGIIVCRAVSGQIVTSGSARTFLSRVSFECLGNWL